MNSYMRNIMIIGAIGAVAGYSMYRQSRNLRRPLKRTRRILAKATNMF